MKLRKRYPIIRIDVKVLKGKVSKIMNISTEHKLYTLVQYTNDTQFDFIVLEKQILTKQ